MVLIHGYGGAAVVFYRIIKDLSDKFHLYLIDILGMGGSSRPAFTLRSPDDADEYFIKFIE